MSEFTVRQLDELIAKARVLHFHDDVQHWRAERARAVAAEQTAKEARRSRPLEGKPTGDSSVKGSAMTDPTATASTATIYETRTP